MSRKKQVSLRALFVFCITALMALSLLWGGEALLFSSTANAETAAPKTAEQIVKDDYWEKLHAANKGEGDTLVAMELGGEKDDEAGGTRPYTCAEIAEQWTEAVGKADASTYVYVKLMQDWVAAAPSDGERPVFGTASGANNNGFCGAANVGLGALHIAGVKVILDLNGYILDRNLSGSETHFGSVIYISSVSGDLVVVDSNPTREHTEKVQEESGEERLKYSYSYEDETTGDSVVVPVTGGIITGGNACSSGSQWSNPTHGGGIRLYQANLHLLSGTVFGNSASQQGGGVQANGGNNTTVGVVVDGGNIIGNRATNGGGIYTYNGAYVNIKSGHVFANTAISGGGINSSATVTVDGGEIMYNIAQGGGSGGNQGGGVYLSGTGKINVSGGKISNNTASFMGGGIYAEEQTDKTNAGVNISGGEVSRNYAALGGGMHVAAVVNLSGGVITGNSAIHGDGIYFYDGDKATNNYRLELAGPVVLKDNGYSVSDNLYGNATVTVTGNLKSGEGESLKKAEIFISDSFCPIAGYNANNQNVNEQGVPVSPAEYFKFTKVTPDPGEVILDKDGNIVYSIPFKTYYFSSDDGSYYNKVITDIDTTESQYGTRFDYGTYGKHGIAVGIAGEGEEPESSDRIYFNKYTYDSQKETADVSQLGDYEDYSISILKDVGIYIGSGSVSISGGDSQSITIRVIIRPREIKADWVTYDKENKTFIGAAIEPEVSKIEVPKAEDGTEWFENYCYKIGLQFKSKPIFYYP